MDILQIKSQKRYRAFLIVLVYVIVASIGIRFGLYQDISRIQGLLHALILALVLTHICIVDGKIAGKPLSIFSYWLVFMFYGIAVPICIIRAHGKRGLLILIIHSFGLLLVLTVSAFITLLLYESILSKGF